MSCLANQSPILLYTVQHRFLKTAVYAYKVAGARRGTPAASSCFSGRCGKTFPFRISLDFHATARIEKRLEGDKRGDESDRDR